MKTCLLFFLLLANYAFSQKRPTQAEMDKMKRQMEAELKQLEKDDPETAKMVKQMMGQTKTKSTGASQVKPGPQAEFTEKILLKSPVLPPTEAQAKDRLLWYRGKKIDASTLITPSGTVVQYQPAKERLVVQPDPKKDQFSKILSGLKQSEKEKDDLIERADKSKNSYFIYPFVKQGLDGINEAERTIGNSLNNVIEMPPVPSEQRQQKNGAITPPVAPLWMVAYHDEVMQFIKSHQNAPSFSFPSPPEHAFDYCLQCDSVRQKKEAEADSLFRISFAKEETAIGNKAFAVIQAWQQAGQPKEWEQISKDMFDATDFLIHYLSKKSDALLSRYKNDFKALPAVIETVLAIERQKQLVGVDDEDNRLAMVADLLKNSDQYLDEKIKEKNFAEVLNYRWIIATEREKQLLGISDENSFGSLLEKLENFNRFKLTVDAEVKVVTNRDENGNIKDWVAAHLTGSEFFGMFPDSLCRMRLINTKRSSLTHDSGVTPEESYELTLFHLQLKDAKATNASFVGPYEWISTQPMFAASFCHSLDTMILYAFSTYNSFQTLISMKPNTEKWDFPKEGVRESGMISQAMGKAFPQHEIEQEIGEPDTKTVMNALTSGFSENSMLNDMKLRSNVMQLETGAFTAQHTGGLYLTGSLRNKAALIFESTIDGKQNNPDAGNVLIAQLSVKLEHAPL